MESYVSYMPVWAIVLFIAGFIGSIAFIANPAKQAALNSGMTREKARNIWIGIFVFYLIWLGYTSVLALKGAFYVKGEPPQITLYTTLPLTIILFGIVFNMDLFKKLIRAATLQSLVRIHVFRFLGVFFLLLYGYHLINARFAFSAGLGDIITALLAIPVAKAVLQEKRWSTTAVFAWNILGIMDIITLLIIAVLDARQSDITGERGNIEMVLFPFSWFPAFAPATILFLHAGVLKKLWQARKVAVRIAG